MTPALAPFAFEFRRYLERPSCPRCGDTLLAAECSALVGDGHIRHCWSCEACSYSFQTSVEFAPIADAGAAGLAL